MDHHKKRGHESKQENPSSLLLISKSEDATAAVASSSPSRRTPPAATRDRLIKRDEWSEGAVSCLLEAYEAKWVLRNRAKLKGQDWEDVAKFVSSRGCAGAGSSTTKSPKTQTQCKNKIESMKKRYRSESSAAAAAATDAAAAASSSWPFFSRLHLLLRGNGTSFAFAAAAPPPPLPLPSPVHIVQPQPMYDHPSGGLLEESPRQPPPPPAADALPHRLPPNSHGSDDGVKEDGVGTNLSDEKNNTPLETDRDSSTPALYNDKERMKNWEGDLKKMRVLEIKRKRRRSRRRWEEEVRESMKCVAEAVVRWEKAKMETMTELERMRAEAEAKRGEIDLKRTRIIADTQLEIARLFAAGAARRSVDSSLRIGRN